MNPTELDAHFSDPFADWRISAKGNRFKRLHRYCVTVFPKGKHWSWLLAYPDGYLEFALVRYRSQDEALVAANAALLNACYPDR